VIAFVIVAILVHFEITEQFDQTTIQYFHSIIGNPSLDMIMQSITEIGDVYYMLLFGIALIVIKKNEKNRHNNNDSSGNDYAPHWIYQMWSR